MVQELRGWAFGICAAAIACGMIQLLLPKSGLQSIFNMTVSVFFLGCLLSPILLPLPEMKNIVPAKEQLLQEVDRRSQRLAEEIRDSQAQMASGTLRQEAARVLDTFGVSGEKIYIHIHEPDEDGISITECEVQLPPQYEARHDEIRGELLRQLGVNVVIGYEVQKE